MYKVTYIQPFYIYAGEQGDTASLPIMPRRKWSAGRAERADRCNSAYWLFIVIGIIGKAPPIKYKSKSRSIATEVQEDIINGIYKIISCGAGH